MRLGEAEEIELAGHVHLDPLAPVIVGTVPFVHRDHHGPAGLDAEAGDVRILVGNVLAGIEHQHDDVGLLDRLQGLDDRELLDGLEDLALAAQAGGVDQGVVLALALERHGDGIARGARLVEGDDALLAEQRIDERRLADVGPAHHGDARRLTFLAASPPREKAPGLPRPVP
jgi:hypothetical protein